MDTKKIKLNNVLTVIAIIAIFVYIFVQFYSVTHIKLETVTAEKSITYQSVSAKAIVVRDEQVVQNPGGAVNVPCVEEGGKVKVGGNIAMKFSDEEKAAAYSKYAEIQKEIEYYEKLETQTIAQTSSIETINADIDSELNNYIRAIENNSTGDIENSADKINDFLLRRQMIIGEEVDLMKIIQQLNKELEKYASSSTPDDYVSSQVSGVFSSYTDGYENIIPYENAETADVTTIENALKKVSEKKDADDSFGKLITSYVWYFESVLDVEDVKDLRDGQKVTVALKNSDDTTINAEILSGAEPVPGQAKTALILKCNEMTPKLASLRCEDIEIRINEYEGIKVPAAALHVNGDKKGVYALVSSQVNFRETEVIYSEDDWVILRYEPDNPKGIRLHDKIITQGKELWDGKVYT